MVSEARTSADRVRAESERELAAAAQRRDSINAQLSNVRQMLATLTGTSVLGVGMAQPEAADEQPDAADAQPKAPAEGDAPEHTVER